LTTQSSGSLDQTQIPTDLRSCINFHRELTALWARVEEEILQFNETYAPGVRARSLPNIPHLREGTPLGRKKKALIDRKVDLENLIAQVKRRINNLKTERDLRDGKEPKTLMQGRPDTDALLQAEIPDSYPGCDDLFEQLTQECAELGNLIDQADRDSLQWRQLVVYHNAVGVKRRAVGKARHQLYQGLVLKSTVMSADDDGTIDLIRRAHALLKEKKKQGVCFTDSEEHLIHELASYLYMITERERRLRRV